MGAQFRFQPGKSGNPLGRPKSLHDHRESCRDLSELGRQRMEHIIIHGADRDAVTAIREMWANGWGRPAQRVELTGAGGEPVRVTYDEVRQKLNDAAARLAAARAGTETDAGGAAQPDED